jgi:hypothetical protein
MDLAARKAVEIELKLASLKDESDLWKKQTGPGSKFPQHTSQIAEVWRVLDRLRTKAEASQAALGVHQTSMLVLSTYRLWEFFRSKFAQRLVDEYRGYLAWADQLAWNCYSPVRAYTQKAPPLVYLNGGFSPFVARRDSAYSGEIIPYENFTDEDAIAAQKKLPFPIIGVPYYQVKHFAEMPSIAHEVGHVVEDDLELTGALIQLFKDTLGSDHPRLDYWSGWRRELFADVWGCLGAGPAFLSALADFKFGQRPESPVPVEETKYPPPWLRIAFSRSILEGEPLRFDVSETLQPFDTVFPHPDNAQPFLDDAKSLAGALLSHRFDKVPRLPSLFSFSAEQQRRAQSERDGVFATPPRAIVNEPDIRVVAAAYRLAYDQDARRVSETATTERFTAAFNDALHPDARAEFGDVAQQAEARAAGLFEIFKRNE